MTMRVPLALGVAALVAALAACGNGSRRSASATAPTTTVTRAPAIVSKAVYVARMRKLGATLGTEVNDVYPISTGAQGSALEKETEQKLERARVMFERVLAGVRSMQPPRAVAGDHRRLERGLAAIGAELQQVVADLRAGNLQASLEPSRLAGLNLVTAATANMQRKGYDVLG
ncbi:MAG TPA: hypothetical protein VGU02_05040 [Gaiellaceae bacterium]|nr:hypothetical protein [Gaiellaceae bacterium]